MLVIHIGPRKTGTTYLQNNFHRHRRALLKAGWLYPQVSLRVQSAHHEIVSARSQFRAGEGVMVDRLARAVRKAKRRNANMFLSSEGFRKWTADDLHKLGDITGHKKVTVVYTLRDPVSRLASLWGENVKNGRRTSLPDFVEKAMANPLASVNLNPVVELKPIIDHPELDLIVLDSEAIRRHGDDIFTVFCREALGLEGLAPARTHIANSSFSTEINDYLRLLSRHLDYSPSDEDQSMMLARQVQHSHGAKRLAAIEELVRTKGDQARALLTIDRSDPWFADLETAIGTALGPFLRPRDAADHLFSRDIVTLPHHDIARLAKIPEVAAQLELSARLLRDRRPLWKRSHAQAIWRRIKRIFVI